MDGEKPRRPQPYTKNYRSPRKVGRVILCQLLSLENIHTSNITWTEQVIFRNTYVYTYTHTHVTTNNEKEVMDLRESQRGVWEGIEGGKGEMMLSYYNLKKNRKN